MPSSFDAYLSAKHAETLATRDRIESSVRECPTIAYGGYPLTILRDTIARACGVDPEGIDIATLSRDAFDADIAIRVPWLLREVGVNTYRSETMPRLVETILALRSEHPYIIDVHGIGIYINIRLSETYLYGSLALVSDLGWRYGESDCHRGESIITEYSSPNAAKHLHAGHIRSTIIGHILGNLSEAVGYTVHRINHLNDWGGIGFIMEGYERWRDVAPAGLSGNDLLFHIYGIFRKGQKYTTLTHLPAEAREELTPYYGDFSTIEEFRICFEDFRLSAEARFARLEAGDAHEVALWQQCIAWSLADFDTFYDLLGMRIDYTIGESFYASRGREIVREGMGRGTIVHFTRERADIERIRLAEARDNGKITEKQYEKISQEIDRDIGAYLVILPDFERFVVLKGNESTIYATRDIATYEYRVHTFHPAKIIHEVGQEQGSHFQPLFRACRQIFGFPDAPETLHIFHGFYVDAKTGVKLSSRDGAASVSGLINGSIEYFRQKYSEDSDISSDERDRIAHTLGVGSVIYHDIKKDRKSSIGIYTDTATMAHEFEESGGAYVIYASCRAKSILRKYGKVIPSVEQFPEPSLEPVEYDLVKRIWEFPEVILRAESAYNPTIVAEYLFQLAAAYNHYYATCPVLTEGGTYRLPITRAVAQVLDNGLRICSIGTLERI